MTAHNVYMTSNGHRNPGANMVPSKTTLIEKKREPIATTATAAQQKVLIPSNTANSRNNYAQPHNTQITNNT